MAVWAASENIETDGSVPGSESDSKLLRVLAALCPADDMHSISISSLTSTKLSLSANDLSLDGFQTAREDAEQPPGQQQQQPASFRRSTSSSQLTPNNQTIRSQALVDSNNGESTDDENADETPAAKFMVGAGQSPR